MIRRRLSLAADQRGAAVIELAMIAPVLALTVVGIVDMSNAFSRKLALEQGAQRAIEKIMQTTETSTVQDTLTTEAVCQVNGMNADGSCKTSPIAASNVSVSWRRECTDAGGTLSNAPGSPYSSSTDFDNTANACPAGTAAEANYIQVRIDDAFTPMFPIHFASINADGTYHLSATAGMRTK
jgi:Flp pilus assembly protein TadG